MRGFTLIELLVTIAIFVFMTALLVARYNAFNQGTLLSDQAYTVALAVRTAQSYGIGVKNSDTSGGKNFGSAYGLHFDTVADATKFGLYPFSVATPPVLGSPIDTQYVLKQGATISHMCVGTGPGACGTTVTTLDIVYRRPNPEAYISAAGVSSKYAEITVSSAGNTDSRIVQITQNGQISVSN